MKISKNAVLSLVGLAIILIIASIVGYYNVKERELEEFTAFIQSCKNNSDEYFSESNEDYEELINEAEEAIEKKDYDSFSKLQKEIEKFIGDISSKYTEELNGKIQELRSLNLSFLESSISEVEKLISSKNFNAARNAISDIYKKNSNLILEKKKSDLKDSFKKQVNFEEGKNTTFDFFFNDYDKDGIYEAFVVIGKNENNIFKGELWFINNDLLQKLEDISTSDYKNFTIDNGDILHFEVPNIKADGSSTATIWQFKGNKVEKVLTIDNGYVVQDKEGFLYLKYATEDMEATEENPESFNGKTIKSYFLYYENEYKEYIGNEISKDEFLGYNKGKQILDELDSKFKKKFPEAKSIEINNIISRNNGIIHINYIVNNKDGKIYQKNVLIKNEGGTLTIVPQDNDNGEKEEIRDGKVDLSVLN